MQSNPSAGGSVDVYTRTFYVYKKGNYSNEVWFASTIVHEAVHVRQFRQYLEYRNIRNVSTTTRRITFFSTLESQIKLETEALKLQIHFLKDIKGQCRLLAFAESFVGTTWWT